jgi:hypothetical protein
MPNGAPATSKIIARTGNGCNDAFKKPNDAGVSRRRRKQRPRQVEVLQDTRDRQLRLDVSEIDEGVLAGLGVVG